MDIVHTAIREDKLETYYNDGGIGRGADVLRFFLTPLICIVSFGFPTLFDANIPHLSDYVAVLCNFILPVFFILSGFFVLPADEKVRREKLNRAVKRTGLFFVCLAVCMLLFAYLYYVLLYKIYNPQVSLSTLASYHASGFRTLASSKRVWFEFLVLCRWPFEQGFSVWYVQAMFYGYVFLWILDRLKLWKFYKPIMIATLLFGLVTVELSGFIPFNFLGYTSIPVCYPLAFAIPCLLLGAFLRENYLSLLKIHPAAYWSAFILGLGIAFGELSLLITLGRDKHYTFFIGFLIAALGICGWALVHPNGQKSFVALHGRSYLRRIYLLSQPVAVLMILFINWISVRSGNTAQMLYHFSTLFIFLICFAISVLIGWIKFAIKDAKRELAEIRDQERQIKSFQDGQQNSNEVRR